jgi:hypothetical protein
MSILIGGQISQSFEDVIVCYCILLLSVLIGGQSLKADGTIIVVHGDSGEHHLIEA